MSALGAAQARAKGALDRLERALSARVGPEGGMAPVRDVELLQRECEALRRELAAATERSARLAAVVAEVEGRLDGAILRVDGLAGGAP